MSIRRHRRIRVHSPEALHGQGLRDISESGLFVVSDDLLEIGQRIQLDIDIGIWHKGLHVIGRVVRVQRGNGHEPGMAVHFENLDEESLRWLERLVADLERLGREPSNRADMLPPWKARAAKRGPHDTDVLIEDAVPREASKPAPKPSSKEVDTRPMRVITEADLRGSPPRR